MFTVVFHSGPRKGRRVVVHAREARLGSGDDCDVRIPAEYSGTAPAIIRADLGGFSIRIDHEGALLAVNDRPVRDAKVRPGDRIQLHRIQFSLHPLRGGTSAHRRTGTLQGLTMVATVLVMLLEVALLAGFILLQRQYPTPALPPGSELVRPAGGETGAPAEPGNPAAPHPAPLPETPPESGASSPTG